MVADRQVLFHVLGAGRAGQRQHPHGLREAENNLGRGDFVTCGNFGHHWVAQHFRIGSQQREALVHDVSIFAKQSHIAIPAEPGVAAILNERRSLGVDGRHLHEVPPRNVAHAEQTRAPGIPLLYHCGPDFGI